jgi:hypothetical protein
MAVDFSLTPAQWQAAMRRALTRAVKLTRSVDRGKELADAAIAEALDPDARPWDPNAYPDLGDYLCSLVWSLHGNELTSYRVTHASERLSEAEDESVPSSRNPDRLVMEARDEAKAARRNAALLRRVQGDALVLLLLEDSDDDESDEDGERPAERIAEPPSTRRALEKGYTLKEIKNARERLKRHAQAVIEDEGKEP